MLLDEYETSLETMRDTLPANAHISTMTFTTIMSVVPETLHVFLSSVTDDMILSRGMTDMPVIRPSTFSPVAFDIHILPNLAPKVKARVFTTTGSIVITGADSHMLAFLAVDDLERLFGIPIGDPEPKLININFSMHIPLDIYTIAKNLQKEVKFVDLPEQYSNRLIVGTSSGKIQLFGSGSVVIHAASYASATKTWTTVSNYVLTR
jgi:hypothetical protein